MNDAEQKLAKKILPILHRYKYGDDAMLTGKTMSITDGHAEASEIVTLLQPTPSVQGDGLDNLLDRIGYTPNTDSREYAKAAIQAQIDEAETSGAIKMLDNLYKGGYIGQWDYDRIRLKLTTQPKPSKEAEQ